MTSSSTSSRFPSVASAAARGHAGAGAGGDHPFPLALSLDTAGGHAGAGACGDHPFPLALNLGAAVEPKPVSSQAPSPCAARPVACSNRTSTAHRLRRYPAA